MNESIEKVFVAYGISEASKLRVSALVDKCIEIKESESLYIKERISETLKIAQQIAVNLLWPLTGEYKELFSRCLVGTLIGCIKIDEHGVRFETGLLSIPGEEVLACAATRQEFIFTVNAAWGHTEDSHGLGQISSNIPLGNPEEIPNSPLERVGFNLDLVKKESFGIL